MSFTALENIPIQVNLLTQANDTGWSLLGDGSAVHSCNPGSMTLFDYPVTAGQTYQTTYIVNSISSGNVQVQSPGSNGAANTTIGLKTDTITPTADGFISIYSNANCSIKAFTVQLISNEPGVTIVYDAINQKWSDFRSYFPDFGWSLFTRTIVAYQGKLYYFQNGNSSSTNNFFGTAFQSSIQFTDAKNPGIIKDYEALSYQANMLFITPLDGVQTSNGQVSTLIDTDFIKQKLSDGSQSVLIYDTDGVYSASFLGDENESNIVDGASLRGNYIIITLVTVDGSTPMALFSINVRTKAVFIGSRP